MTSPINNPALIPPGVGRGTPVRVPTQPVRPGAGSGAPSDGPAFADFLRDAQRLRGDEDGSPVQFSKHAVQRLQRRGLEVDGAVIGRLTDGIDCAAAKGSRDAVVLVDDAAFVCSVTNRTVITAVGREQMKNQVFTNIDAAVIA